MRKYSNKAKAILFTSIALLLYLIPIVVIAIINKDRLFKETGTSLTFFSVLCLVFFLIFAKKLVKQICGVITIAGFASIVMLVLSLAIKSLVDNLMLISIASIIGATLAWYPTKVAQIFSECSKDQNGMLRADLTFRDVNNVLFGISAEE